MKKVGKELAEGRRGKWSSSITWQIIAESRLGFLVWKLCWLEIIWGSTQTPEKPTPFPLWASGTPTARNFAMCATCMRGIFSWSEIPFPPGYLHSSITNSWFSVFDGAVHQYQRSLIWGIQHPVKAKALSHQESVLVDILPIILVMPYIYC
jgi:hypothetical protein